MLLLYQQHILILFSDKIFWLGDSFFLLHLSLAMSVMIIVPCICR